MKERYLLEDGGDNSFSLITDYDGNDEQAFDVNVNTEDRTMEYIEINGCDGFIVDISNEVSYISWDNGEYIFEISGSIGKNELISVAETVQKAEQ